MTQIQDAHAVIGLDISMFRRQLSGIGNYALNLIGALILHESEMQFGGYDGLFFRPINQAALGEISACIERLPQASDGRGKSVRRLPGMRPLVRQIKRRIYLRGVRRVQLFHALNFFAPFETDVPVLATVYDLSVARHPETHPAARVAWFEAHAEVLTRQPLINTISCFSASEISKVLGIDRDRIRVTYPGVSGRFSANRQSGDGAVLSKFNLNTESYFLAVGTLEPRKNLGILLTAYESLSERIRRVCPLVVVGQPGWGDFNVARLDRLEREGALRLAGYQDEEVLSALYRHATTLLFPSIYEGFGMPTLEALASGLRPVLSDIPVMREVGAHAADYAAPHDVEAWISAMTAAFEASAGTRRTAREIALLRAAEFGWADTARATAAIYRELIGD